MCKNVLCLLLIILVQVFARDGDPMIVKLPQGKVQGTQVESVGGRPFEAYLGIPYAKPPVGKSRFKAPQTFPQWAGVYNATTYGSDCLQYSHLSYSVTGAEDCLFVNVFRPVIKPENKGKLFDVIVHIHGGAFMFMSPRYFEPNKLFNRKDVLYVSFNYRLGPLGFMSTGDKALPGNLGLKDQSFALKWIKENIQYFGGNPNKITITGLSAGGASVHYHLISPLSRGLFHRAVSGSGCALNPWSFAEDVPQKTRLIAANLGCPTQNSEDLVKCLNSRPAEQIVSQVPVFLKWLFNPYSPFGPTVEPEGTEHPFLPRHPFDIIKDGQIAQVPWIISFTTSEGLYPAAEFVDNNELLNELESRWNELAPHVLDYNYTVPLVRQGQITDLVTGYYLKGKKLSDARTELVQMIGDRLFGAGIVQSAIMHARVSDKVKAPVYLYHFAYRGKYSVSELFSHSDTDLGVCHGDDMGYILSSDIFHMDQTEGDRNMENRLVDLWLKFADKGVPEFFANEALPRVQDGLPNLKYLRIESDSEAVVKTTENLAEFQFWSEAQLDEKLSLPDSVFRKLDEL